MAISKLESRAAAAPTQIPVELSICSLQVVELSQSVSAKQESPDLQGGQDVPPQSISISPVSTRAFEQLLGIAQMPREQGYRQAKRISDERMVRRLDPRLEIVQ